MARSLGSRSEISNAIAITADARKRGDIRVRACQPLFRRSKVSHMSITQRISTVVQSARQVVRQEEVDEQHGKRGRWAPLALLSPALILMSGIFAISMVMLFVNSAYHFTGLNIERTVTFEAWPGFFTDPFQWQLLGRTLWLATVTTALGLLIGYPTAYAVTRLQSRGLKLFFFIIIFSPLLTSVVVRSFGWLILLGSLGFVNYVLRAMQLIEEPLRMIYNFTGVTIALTHVLLPFTIFPIVSVMMQMDKTLKEAAADLGANRWTTFRRITWPLTLPGVVSGAQITFVLAAGAYATPAILGGGRVLVLPAQIYQSIVVLNWPLAAVQAMVLLAISLIIIFLFNVALNKVYRNTAEVR
jgi:putative spermidine/putrescine transport system permease protein